MEGGGHENGDDTIIDASRDGLSTDDVTPTDDPGSAVRRFTGDLRELCQGFDQLSPLIADAPRSDRPFLFKQFGDLAGEIVRAAQDLRDAMTAQIEIENALSRRPIPTTATRKERTR